MDLTIECPDCRGRQFIRTADPRRDETVTCGTCAAEFHYGQLEDTATQSVRDSLARAFPTMLL